MQTQCPSKLMLIMMMIIIISSRSSLSNILISSEVWLPQVDVLPTVQRTVTPTLFTLHYYFYIVICAFIYANELSYICMQLSTNQLYKSDVGCNREV